jgi:3-hydroxyacyl-[acyl-carrier-protein] dehydratase
VAIKNVTLAEESLDDYLPGHPHYPHSLIVEGMAQTGGLLLSQMEQFLQRVVLAKIAKADFFFVAKPGDQLRLSVKLVGLQAEGALVEGTVDIDGKRQAEMELTFAILDESFGKEPFFIPRDLLRVLRAMRLFEVARTVDGEPITIPQHMLDDENAYLATNAI